MQWHCIPQTPYFAPKLNKLKRLSSYKTMLSGSKLNLIYIGHAEAFFEKNSVTLKKKVILMNLNLDKSKFNITFA